MTINPVLVLFISFIIINEKLTARKISGIIFGIIGAIFLILSSGDPAINNSTKLGNIFIFINATSYAIYLVLVKPLIKKYNPATIMFYVFLFGLLYVIPFGYRELQCVNWIEIPKYIFFEIIFVVVFTTFIAYLLNSMALKKLNPSIVSIYIYLQPILATFFAIYMEKDSLSIEKMIAIIFVFFGVYLVSTRIKHQDKPKLF
jgi:drug/metabolite transporter (DMT)-like permease